MSKDIDGLDGVDLEIAALDLPEGSSADELEQALTDRYEMSLEAFQSIAELLIRFTPVLESMLTGEKYYAFIDKDGMTLAKVAVEEEEK
jgi:hypothetical protein